MRTQSPEMQYFTKIKKALKICRGAKTINKYELQNLLFLTPRQAERFMPAFVYGYPGRIEYNEETKEIKWIAKKKEK